MQLLRLYRGPDLDIIAPNVHRALFRLARMDLGVPHSKVGSAVHALELAHAAKFNLGTTWGVGESCVVGPGPHHRTGQPAGSGYVAVAGPGPETTGVLKLEPHEALRSENMLRIVCAAFDLMEHLQGLKTKQVNFCAECGRQMAPTEKFCAACGTMRRGEART